jgi:hypothetical protein
MGFVSGIGASTALAELIRFPPVASLGGESFN